MRLLLKNWVLNCKTGIMKKIIYILFGMLAWWSCEDENSLIGPEGVFSEYTDSRDGKIYRCVTIGDQTWMAENLAYRLPLGSVDGCYTYREENLDTNRIEPARALFDEVVQNAINDGKISSDPLPEVPFFSPASFVMMYLDYPGSAVSIVNLIANTVTWYPSMQSTVETLNQILAETKTKTIGLTAEEYFLNAEEENDGYAEKYGLLYTYDAALKALPDGWRLPTDEDWKKLETELYMDGDEWNEKVAETLSEGEHSFEFYQCETLQELQDDVAGEKAECGYYFPAGFRELLKEGGYRRSVKLYVSPSTVADKLSSEVVFAGFFQVFGRELLEEYTRTGQPFEEARAGGRTGMEPEQIWEELEPLYDQYLENGSTFAFEYRTMGAGVLKKDSVTAVFPVRGICAVFIFVMGLAAAVTAGEDESTAGRKRSYLLAQLAAPVLLSCVSSFICLTISGNLRGIGREWAALLVYGLMTLLFSYILLMTVRSPLVISGLIPFFILGSLIICPVFADLSVFVPVLGVLRRFFLLYYYLIM